MTGALRRLARDERGVYAIEFAILAPVMCLMMMGGYDLLHRNYVQDVLDGEMQKVARDSALEGAPIRLPEIDARMQKMVKIVSYDATAQVTRTSYPSFLSAKAERFIDENDNGTYDKGECFDDINDNKAWDKDPGKKNQGGANDVTKIRTVIKFPRLFPMHSMLGWEKTQTLASETMLKNQPFAAQATTTSVAICD